MKIAWSYDLQNEIGAYLFTAGYIAKGYFGTKAFYIAPDLPVTNNESVILFPDFGEPLSPKQWEYALKNDFDVPVQDKKFPNVANIEKQIKSFGILEEKELQNIKDCWNEKADLFLSSLSNMFTNEQIDISKITIYPTKLGSICAYFYDKEKNEGYVYIRSDMGPGLIMRMVLMIILRKNFIEIQKSLGDKGTLESGIQEKLKTTIDFITRSTKFKTILQNDENFLFKEDANLARVSSDYLSKLGFANAVYLIPEEKGIYNNLKEEYIKNLTQQEEKVLALLIKKLNNLCEYEELAKVMWSEDYLENFSLYAISKVIHKIRTKLKLNGINDYHIKTKRNKGYIFIK